MGNKGQRRYFFGHTIGRKLKCPLCGGVVWEDWDYEENKLDYQCLACGWKKHVDLVEGDKFALIEEERAGSGFHFV